MELKRCGTCRTEKPFSEFHRCISRPDGLNHRCKRCQSEHDRARCNPPVEEGEKVCRTCGEGKPVQSFGIMKISSDGRRNICRECDVRDKVEYRRKRRAEDPLFALEHRLRNLVYNSIVRNSGRKAAKTEELLGCTVAEARDHIEGLFQEGMSWEDRGSFHIDHIKPCASFDLSKESEQRACMHYTNLQPLWAADNIRKGARTDWCANKEG